MTLEEFYNQVGGSLDEAMARLYKEDLIKKYLGMFLRDDSYTKLGEAVAAKDWREVFATSHNLKGMAANLELKNLFEASSVLCEDVRHGDPTGDMDAMYAAVKTEYENAVAAIKQVI